MVDKGKQIDQQTGTTFGTKPIEKEMANIRVGFEVLKVVTPEKMREVKVKPGLNMS